MNEEQTLVEKLEELSKKDDIVQMIFYLYIEFDYSITDERMVSILKKFECLDKEVKERINIYSDEFNTRYLTPNTDMYRYVMKYFHQKVCNYDNALFVYKLTYAYCDVLREVMQCKAKDLIKEFNL